VTGHDRPLFSALRLLAEDPGRDRIFVSDLLSLMQDRAIVALILLFALPNVVPVPSGTTGVLGNDSTGCTCDRRSSWPHLSPLMSLKVTSGRRWQHARKSLAPDLQPDATRDRKMPRRSPAAATPAARAAGPVSFRVGRTT
jgi:hypothetical protein